MCAATPGCKPDIWGPWLVDFFVWTLGYRLTLWNSESILNFARTTSHCVFASPPQHCSLTLCVDGHLDLSSHDYVILHSKHSTDNRKQAELSRGRVLAQSLTTCVTLDTSGTFSGKGSSFKHELFCMQELCENTCRKARSRNGDQTWQLARMRFWLPLTTVATATPPHTEVRGFCLSAPLRRSQ